MTFSTMTTRFGAGLLTSAAIALSAPSFAQETMEASEIYADWPEASQTAAKEMIDNYGQPDEMTEMELIWRDNAPWIRTVVYGYEIDHNWPVPHKDVVEQFINYDVPEDLFDDLAHYDGSVIAERTKGELSARCHAEFANLIALNLAHDLIEGTKTVDEARQAYAEAAKANMEGNPPEIAQKLTFEPPQEDITNSGEAVM